MSAPDLNPVSQQLADLIVRAWAAFLRGNPSPQEWPATRPGSVMRFEPTRVGPVDASTEYQCDFWKAEYPAFFGKPAKETQ